MIFKSGIKCIKKREVFSPYLLIIFLFITYSIANFTGCCSYSFTGASVPQHLNSIAIPIADDRSGSGQANLRERFTESLTQKFIEDNTLNVAERINADAVLECTITSLSDAPAVVAAGEQVESRKVTISVQAVYRDLVKRITVFDQNFSNYGEYNADRAIEGRSEAIEAAINNITEDILLAVVSGW